MNFSANAWVYRVKNSLIKLLVKSLILSLPTLSFIKQSFSKWLPCVIFSSPKFWKIELRLLWRASRNAGPNPFPSFPSRQKPNEFCFTSGKRYQASNRMGQQRGEDQVRKQRRTLHKNPKTPLKLRTQLKNTLPCVYHSRKRSTKQRTIWDYAHPPLKGSPLRKQNQFTRSLCPLNDPRYRRESKSSFFKRQAANARSASMTRWRT